MTTDNAKLIAEAREWAVTFGKNCCGSLTLRLAAALERASATVEPAVIAALESAEEALVDLGACDRADCQSPGCLRALPTVRAALAAIRERGMLREGSAWVPCSERMPDDLTDVLVLIDFEDGDPPSVMGGFRSNGCWRKMWSWSGDGDDGDIPALVIAWQPLPAPPTTDATGESHAD